MTPVIPPGGVGGLAQLGNYLTLDDTLRARQMFDIHAETYGISVDTLEVGLGF